MRSKLRVSVFGATPALVLVLAVLPGGALAQQMPNSPDGTTSLNEPAPAGPTAAVDSCGNTPEAVFGEPAPNGMPLQPTTNPEDVTLAQPMNLSSVTGVVAHAEGNLVLLNLPQLPDMGRANPTPQTPDKSWAVVRLPAGCAHMPSTGSDVTAIGVPTTEGILNAELVQSDQ